MKGSTATMGFLAALSAGSSARADIVLSEKIMMLSQKAAHLAAEAYQPEPACDWCTSLVNYIEEPDQALVAEDDAGYCFGVFRGTTPTAVDWGQNIDPRNEPVCTTKDRSACCTTRQGFYDAYITSYHQKMEKEVRKCASKCDRPNECVVLTGHSQGGAVASIAAVRMADLNPRVITFGEPPALDFPCPPVTSSRWYRYVNTKDSEMGLIGVSYDPVPFVPGMGTQQYGNFVMLGGDPTGTAFIGLDNNDQFSPLNVAGFQAHSMNGTLEFPGYINRIDTLMQSNNTYPIRANGFASPEYCTKNVECESLQCEKETHFSYSKCVSDECEEDKDCKTDRCDSGQCHPKLGSCMECDEDSDCAGGQCLFFRCSNGHGQMDDECNCFRNEDCASGRCEGLAPPTCRATLGEGAHCNEDSDCKSGDCSWLFLCEESENMHVFTASNRNFVLGFLKNALVLLCFTLAICAVGMALRNKYEGYEEIPTSIKV